MYKFNCDRNNIGDNSMYVFHAWDDRGHSAFVCIGPSVLQRGPYVFWGTMVEAAVKCSRVLDQMRAGKNELQSN